MSIHVLCLNPAVDRLYAIDGFTYGKVYTGCASTVSAGGKGVNVARVLSLLGERPKLYAFLAETGGELIRAQMEPLCACVFIPVPGACRVTVNIADRARGCETVVSEAGPLVGEAHVRLLLTALGESLCAGDIVCCSGSIAAGAPPDLYAQISRLCREADARCALDCNASTLPASLAGARYALGKPNESELGAILGRAPARDAGEAAAMARRLMPPYDALLVSMGGRGGVYATRERALFARVPRLSPGFTVGCGDACLAGALCAISRGLDASGVLRLAMACGAAGAAAGAPDRIHPQDIERFRGQIDVRPL